MYYRHFYQISEQLILHVQSKLPVVIYNGNVYCKYCVILWMRISGTPYSIQFCYMVMKAIMSRQSYLLWWVYLLLTLSSQQLTEIDFSLFFLGNRIHVEHHGNSSAPWSMLWVLVKSKTIRLTSCFMESLEPLTSSP